MMKPCIKYLFFVALLGSISMHAQPPVAAIQFADLEPRLHKQNDTVYLINFWATWCAPCREELPAIVAVGHKYRAQKFSILFVSLDFPEQIQTRLLPFVAKNLPANEVVLLNDPNQNIWIPKVDPSWSGNIPFTLIYGKNFREIYARSFTFTQLDSIINLKLK